MVGESLFRTGANKFSSPAEFHIAQFSGYPLLTYFAASSMFSFSMDGLEHSGHLFASTMRNQTEDISMEVRGTAPPFGLRVEIRYRIHKTRCFIRNDHIVGLKIAFLIGTSLPLLLRLKFQRRLYRSMMADSNVFFPSFEFLEFDMSSSGMETPLLMAGSTALAFDTSLMLLCLT